MTAKKTLTEDGSMTGAPDAQVIASLGASMSQPRDVGGVPYTIIPEGYSIEDLSDYLPRPARRAGRADVIDVASFVRYVDRFKTPDTQIFASENGDQITAYLDYHEGGPDGKASFREHSVVLRLRKSPEWNTWTARNGRPMNQLEFAQFLEDNLPDIAAPDGATVLEAAKSLELHKSVIFKRGINTENSTVQLTYNEEVSQGGAVGQIVIPTQFTLGLAVYEGGAIFKVNAKLRYKLDNDKVSFTFLLDRPHKIVEAAFEATLSSVQDATDIEAYLGSAT